MSYYKYLSTIIPGIKPYNIQDKEKCVQDLVSQMVNRCAMIFKWSNLPETIPQRTLELYLQLNGNCAFTEHENKYYILCGGLGGEPDYNYMPTIYTISNPALKWSTNLTIEKDCIIIPNDTMYTGLREIHTRHATILAETLISLSLANINSRIISLISAPDDISLASAERYIRDISNGKLGVIGENAFLDGIRVQPYGASGAYNHIKSLIELYQYTLADWYQELGIQLAGNMKREYLNSTETETDRDVLLPGIDDMLNCRKIAVDKINKKYNLSISVDYNSSWKLEQKAAEFSCQQENNRPNESSGINEMHNA